MKRGLKNDTSSLLADPKKMVLIPNTAYKMFGRERAIDGQPELGEKFSIK